MCGGHKRMPGDVGLALQQIAVMQGGMDAAAATQHLADLARGGRFQRDVYRASPDGARLSRCSRRVA